MSCLNGHAARSTPVVVYYPDLDMVVDLVRCEDVHAQERTLTSLLGPRMLHYLFLVQYDSLVVLELRN
jgi:hypothetical protein